MTIEVKVPMLPESIADATVSTWHKKVGDSVSRDENLVDLETDKVMLEVPAPADGVLKEIIKKTGDVVQANQVIAVIEPGSAKTTEASKSDNRDQSSKDNQNRGQSDNQSRDQSATDNQSRGQTDNQSRDKSATDNQSRDQSAIDNQSRDRQGASSDSAKQKQSESATQSTQVASALSPSARRAASEHDVNISEVPGTGKGGRITKENVLSAIGATGSTARPEKRVPMTRIRIRIAERLMEVKQNTAMLTTFNDINLQHVIEIRNRYKEAFEKAHKTRLGFMSFFVKAAVEALKRYPIINASIDGNDVVYHGYFDIGVAVSTERGLVVPVLRNADQLSMAEIEAKIAEYAGKARAGKLSLEEMQGGTFTITNGGVFGSLLSTPILNSPQSAILGMHKIEQRPIAENGQVVIRPMMYVAMSYDHRIIDGKDSVTFLVAIKEFLEDPARLLLQI